MEEHYKLGLVLSGGGTRGVAHAGILKVLLAAGIKPQVLSGASAGAIISTLYAGGYSPEEMRDFFKQEDIFDRRKLAFAFPKLGLVDLEAFRELFQAYFPEDRFEALSHPIYIMTTNLLTGKAEVFSEGELITPILASCAVPGIFSPIEIDKAPHGDGGIFSNFPSDPLIGKCEALLGIYVHPLETLDAKSLRNPIDVLSRAYDISRSAAVHYKFSDCDHVIIPEDIHPYGVFDTDHIDEIFEAGVRAGEAALAQIREVLDEKGLRVEG
ncbi:MAG: patatin-like phospholipase family protein [Bacteroidota bacterium]